MAKCKTCGKTIRRPKGWDNIGPAVRRHYWKQHPEVMLKAQADSKAERAIMNKKK